MSPPVVLSIAGSDSGAGAGVQADLKTCAALGVFATTAITAVTAQNTTEVHSTYALPARLVEEQVMTVLEDLPVASVKTGMLATAEIADLVADLAERAKLPNLVVDPVLVSSTGTRLLDENAEHVYLKRLMPAATAFTPNRLEAEVLLARDIRNLGDVKDAACELSSATRGHVVVKGGHPIHDSPQSSVDVAAYDGQVVATFVHDRIETSNNHGSGCSFAAATAAFLSRGMDPLDSFRSASDYVHRAIEGAARWRIGSGQGPLDHFHWETTANSEANT